MERAGDLVPVCDIEPLLTRMVTAASAHSPDADHSITSMAITTLLQSRVVKNSALVIGLRQVSTTFPHRLTLQLNT